MTMTAHIVYNSLESKLSTDSSSSVHYIPCLIKSDGAANVSTYFSPKTDDLDPKLLKASFRGHPLNGKVVHVPEGYAGVILQEKKEPLVDNVDRTLHVGSTFDKLTYWNWDRTPSQNDSFIKALDWLEIAEAMHSSND